MDTIELYTVDGSAHGPYAASPVPGTWGTYEPISVTRVTAEQIAYDLNVGDAGCGLTAAWEGANLTFTWDETYQGEAGNETVVPDADGRYRIGGLWPWSRVETAQQPTPFTAGAILRAALAEQGITVHTDGMSPSYAIPLDPTTSALEVYGRPHLLVADRSPSIEHTPDAHTGWVVVLHDETGEPDGDWLYSAGSGDEPVDCTAESVAAAAFIADWLTSHRH
ncbi:hypothetical protein M1P56_35930 (plasmid) [Streptomyces sp. HU2014]|uniref:hypothetical protein n=1 Tax=Streptomyces sp. HU2014 TaxID=2939414 RepID=UPI00200EBCE0|nr:hypothetical protein [Streptomyces sp. HU2014]UQI49794.1 hypothetical protein M1P56_35930 [Streptomyces sp. HU2014]